MTDLLSAALAWQQAGFSVVPCRNDRSKAPIGSWKKYMVAPASGDDIVSWWLPGTIPDPDSPDGFGLVCGASSGGLHLLEFEGRAVVEMQLEAWRQVMADHGLSSLCVRLLQGYLEVTPSGGVHMLFRVSDGPAKGNTKLARRPSTPEELAANPAQKVQTLLETRGEGGYVVVAPSAGRATPYEGKAWQTITGDPTTVPTLTSAERDQLHEVTALLDAMPEITVTPPRALDAPPPADLGERPGDHYNARTDWRDILEPRGWRCLGRSGQGLAWARPGKTDPGPSATTGANDADNLYVFSSSTEFATEQPYSKFAAYALLDYGGDHAAAAKALREQGYGGERPVRDTTALAKAEVDDWTTILGYAPGAYQALNTAPAPRIASSPSVPAPRPPSPAGKVTVATTTAQTDRRTQLSLAERLVVTYGHELRHVHGVGWHVWDGMRWKHETDKASKRFAIETIRSAYGDLHELDTEKAKVAFQQLRKMESDNAITGILGIAAALKPAAVAIESMNTDPYLLNTHNGTLDLRTGELRAHDPNDLITRVTGCGYDPDAAGPGFQQFLSEIQPDADMREFIARIFGHALVGKVIEHVMPIFTGEGQNGKSTLLDTVAAAFGDYAIAAEADLLIERGPTHSTGLTDLLGVRLAVCSEIDEGKTLAAATMKRLTGGDKVRARRMRQDNIEFDPSHTVLMVTNHKPRVAGDDAAVWRRIRLVPFDIRVPRPDPMLKDRLSLELSAVLAWAVAGCADWRANGLAEPAKVLETTQAYQASSDVLGQFIEDRCMVNPSTFAKSSELFAAWSAWCHAANQNPGNDQAFAEAMKRRGHGKVRKSFGVIYTGLALLSTDNRNDSDDRSNRYK